MKQIILLTEKILRIAGSQDKPMLCGQDVCEMLGLANNRQALASLPESEKGVIISDTPGGPQPLVFVTEPGFYRLVFKSRKPEAEAFKDKVFNDILPAIRKTGYYRATQSEIPPEIAELPAGRKDQVMERLEACEEIRASRRVLACAKEISQRHSGRGFSWRTLLKWYYRWVNSGFNAVSLIAYRASYKALPRIP
jgi:prophage antirepressor-like protein